MTDERKAQIDREWSHRTGAWKAPFKTKLNDVMVGAFYDDDDYDEIRAYLVAEYEPMIVNYGL